jgi:hypothetical protein
VIFFACGKEWYCEACAAEGGEGGARNLSLPNILKELKIEEKSKHTN